MTVEVRTSGRDEYPKYLRMLITGEHGVGKTRLASTSPDPLWIACSPGIATLSQFRVPFVSVETEEQLLEVKTLLEAEPAAREAVLGHPVNTLVVDCVDELQRLLMLDRLRKERRSEISFDDWNWISQRMNAIFTGLNSLEMHIIYITHLKDVVDGDKVTYKPAIQGSFIDQIHNYVDISSVLVGEGLVDSATIDEWEISKGDTNVTENSRFLITVPTKHTKWTNDKTLVTGGVIDVNFEDDILEVVGFMEELRSFLPDSTSVESPPEETVEETVENIPGMSNDERIEDLLENSIKTNESEQENLTYVTNTK